MSTIITEKTQEIKLMITAPGKCHMFSQLFLCGFFFLYVLLSKITLNHLENFKNGYSF